MIRRRTLLAGLGAGFALGPLSRARAAGTPVTIRMGSLKLIHSIAPSFYERFTPRA